jgi:GNAT superfamily N-acetyltransferase
MEPLALATLEHENWISYLAASVSLHERGVAVRDRGIVTLLGHVPMRFFNQILVEDSSAAESAIVRAVSLGREHGDPFVVGLRDGIDDRFKPLMAELGLVAADEAATQAMTLYPVRDRRTARAPANAFDIRKVTNEAGLDHHRRVVTAGFRADASVAEAMLGIEILRHPESSAYVGYLDGQPVSAGFGWRTGRTIGVYNIATLPTARRQGFGEAMTARVVADGETVGCDVAALQASAMGRPIYERIGFRMSVRYTGYVDASERWRSSVDTGLSAPSASG